MNGTRLPPELPDGRDSAFVGIGASVLRKEDARFLIGRGRYLGDMAVADALHCHVVRSPHAHARLGPIGTAAAAAAPGVAAVFTGADMAADGIGPMPCLWRIQSKDGGPMAEPPRWAIARGVVRHVGEPVAVVVADGPERAADAAERIEIDYDVRPAVADAGDAVADGAPQLHDEAAGNVCFRWTRGDPEAVEDAFRRAAHVVRAKLTNNRIAGAALENRCALGVYDPVADRHTLYATTQAPHLIRRSAAAELGVPEGALRVVAPDMGGGFGYKGKHYPEETIVVWAAKRLRRPVRWTGSRGEAFVSDTQARDHATEAALALDGDGRFLGLRVETMADLGAYLSTFGPAIPSAIYGALLAGVYRTPAVSVEVTGVFTNTTPTDAYRGAGRPEACFVLERLCDQAAAALGLDRREIRRRNLIPAGAMPYATPVGPTYDCGDFGSVMAQALEAAEYDSFAARREESRRRGLLRGVSVANFVESSGVAPSRLAGALGARVGFFEAARVSVDPAGGVHAFLGTHNHGQAHETTFAQILADRLGAPFDRIRVSEGDTDTTPLGTGTFGSRSIAVGGSALDRAAAKIVAKGKRIAAHLLEAAPADIEFGGGRFVVAGTDRTLSFAEMAHAAHAPHDYPLEELEPGLDETAGYDPPNFAFSNGSHVCEVEVDPETGSVRLAAYRAVDDIGVVVNPMVAEGQIHGGLAQGVGQALMEVCRYDRESGQALSGSFMDYALPRADDLPCFESTFDESQPCTHNPLGAKGCGESGAIGAPPAIVGAVLDALRPLGVDDIEMPLTPFRVWRAIRAAGRGP